MIKYKQWTICLLLLIFSLAVPVSAAVNLEWKTDARSDFTDSDSGSFWETGLQAEGDWTLGTDWTFYGRGKVKINNDSGEWDPLLERSYLQYQAKSFRVKLGRQAVNWGVGWLFRPTDVITPRTVYNEEETRPGKDLAAFYWATSPLTATELIIGEHLAAGRTELRVGKTNLRLTGIVLPGGEKLLGVDFQGGLANFYGEAIYCWDEQFSTGKPTVVLGWKSFLASDALLYLEYFRNDLGFTESQTGKNYLGFGLDIPWDQLTTINLAGVTNLDDWGTSLTGSILVQLSDQLDLNGGLTVLFGDAETEFVKSAQGSRKTMRLQLKYYF